MSAVSVKRKLAKNTTKLSTFIEIRAQLKEEFDSCPDADDPKKFLAVLRARFEQEQNTPGAEMHLKLFVIIIRILLLEERFGIIGQKESDKYIRLAENMLLLQGVLPNSRSDLHFLYGDLRNISGQITRRRGDHLSSLWESQLALRAADPKDQSNLHLVLSNRLIRVGRVTEAAHELGLVNRSTLNEYESARVDLARVQIMRLERKFDEVTQLIVDLKAFYRERDARVYNDLQWFELTTQFQISGNAELIERAIRRGGSYYSDLYICEGILWILASRNKLLIPNLPQVAKLKKSRRFDFASHKISFEIVDALQFAYDTSVDLEVRIRQLSHILRLFSQCTLLENEMLAWLAVGRFLSRSRASELSETCIQRYRQHSITVSKGSTSDALNLGVDDGMGDND